MVNVKLALEYLIGSDIREVRRTYYQNIGERSSGIRVAHVLNDIATFGIRYASTGLGVDGIRRLADGQYVGGAIELLAAGYFGIDNYLGIKRQGEIMNLTQEVKEENEQVTGELRETAMSLRDAAERLRQKSEPNSQQHKC